MELRVRRDGAGKSRTATCSCDKGQLTHTMTVHVW